MQHLRFYPIRHGMSHMRNSGQATGGKNERRALARKKRAVILIRWNRPSLPPQRQRLPLRNRPNRPPRKLLLPASPGKRLNRPRRKSRRRRLRLNRKSPAGAARPREHWPRRLQRLALDWRTRLCCSQRCDRGISSRAAHFPIIGKGRGGIGLNLHYLMCFSG